MKKGILIGVIIGIVLTGATAYAAYKYQASKVGYTPSNSNFKVDNVEDAIEELYNNRIYKEYENGTAIYYNPETNQKCTSNEAVSATGTKTGCMKWYTFNDEGKSSAMINLILDHNTTALVGYNDSNSSLSVKELGEALVNDTKTWKIGARIISAPEIATITNKSSFDGNNVNSYFYFDGGGQSKTNNYDANNRNPYAWLFDYTSKCKSDSVDYGCNIEDNNTYTNFEQNGSGVVQGYWTINSFNSSYLRCWTISSTGYIQNNAMLSNNKYAGIRPVITISKAIIK